MKTIKYIKYYLAHPSKAFCRQYWDIGLLNNITLPQSPDKIADMLHSHKITWLYPKNPENFIADPFLTTYFGEPLLFFERIDATKGKGNISYANVSELLSDPEHAEQYFHTALELDTHLSYPCLFEYERKLYMIPENSKSNTVTIYKCTGEPNSWKKEKTIFEQYPGIDPTIFFYNNLWWLFVTKQVAETRTEDTDLDIWYAKNPLGEWTLHPSSPIHYDDASARGAGKPFEINGMLYHPTQDCSKTYGGKLIIKRIVNLDTTIFAEETVDIINGVEPRELALHTFSSIEGIGVIDGKYEVYSLENGVRNAELFMCDIVDSSLRKLRPRHREKGGLI